MFKDQLLYRIKMYIHGQSEVDTKSTYILWRMLQIIEIKQLQLYSAPLKSHAYSQCTLRKACHYITCEMYGY
jgi:hypothetical protein